jgi:hypothetical protein
MDPTKGSKGIYYQPLNQHELEVNITKGLKQGIIHETKSVGVEALTGKKIEDLKKNANLKNKVTIKKEFEEGQILRNQMQGEMKIISETLRKLDSKQLSKDKKPQITEKTLEKLALLKLAIDRCDKEAAEGGPYRQFRQNVAKTLGYSTTNDARSLIQEFNKHLSKEQRVTVLIRYNVFVNQYSILLQDRQKKQEKLEKKMNEDPIFKIGIKLQKDIEKNTKIAIPGIGINSPNPFAQFNPFSIKNK